ncbi:MAG TPA: alpha-L-rhamnosidase C-terminal domain-containing protein [Actinospica sp.]|nr:alpha-L-rhamnosidase C-terminal domain-containing protein [Actinospica sp.]
MTQSPTSGTRRRTLMKSGVGLAAVAVAGVPTQFAGRAAAASGPPWQQYVVGPTSDNVSPVRVIATTGEVGNPDALLKRGGTATVLTRPKPPTPPTWPAGTTATASSFHDPNSGDNGTPTTYDPSNAIDDDPTTFWNDANPNTYPAILTITSPTAVTLDGVTLLSNSDGVPVDFTVQTWDGSAWQTSATVTGNAAVQVPIPFDAPVTTTQVQLVVTLDQASPQGQFTRVNELYPGLVDVITPPSVTIDFGKNLVGYPHIDFAWASAGNPGVRLAFSETVEYLTDRSDFARSDNSGGGPGTDQYAVPAQGASWTDTEGYQTGTQVYAEGLHGFRYMKITLDALATDAPAAVPYGQVAIDAVSLKYHAYLGTPESYAGWFMCSDDALNRYWFAAAYTNELVVAPFLASDCDPRNAASASLLGELVIQDGAKRDRDPYVGDIAVSGRTLYLTHPDAAAAARNVLADLAEHQRADGWIPPASINGYTLPLFDYPLWWVTASWDYVLYTGDTGYAKTYYPTLLAVLDTWYPSVTDGSGLLNKGLNGTGGYGDYAFLPRSGEVTYYNANYVQALNDAASMANALGKPSDAARWTQRAATVAAAINSALWDASVGAYLDSGTGDVRHAQDGNSIAITAGIADAARASAALTYLESATKLPYGNAFMDNDTLSGVGDASQRVYAFTSYPEIVARFRTGGADSAIDQIKRTYGWMYANDPGITAWEGIGPGGTPYEGAYTSMAHGWSTGVLPALTNELLGVTPTGPGFSTWTVTPHPGSVTWASGQVPTPHGPLGVQWRVGARGLLTIELTVPAGTTGTVAVDGHAPVKNIRAGRRTITIG